MFGTIARLQVKPGMKDKLLEVLAEDNLANIAGWVADYLFESVNDPGQCFLVAFFEDEQSYMENAGSPAQDERYQQMRACLLSDPEWQDGQVVSATGPRAVH